MGFQAFLIMMVIQVAVTFALALLQPKPDIEGQRAKGLGDFQFPTATENRMIPILWGTMDIRGPNVTWYGDLKSRKVTKSVRTGMFSKEDVTQSIRYFIGIDLLLCYGPVDRVTRLEVSDKEAFTGSVSPSLTDNGFLQFISNVKLFGGTAKGGGIQGNFRIYGGTEQQVRDPYLQGQLGVNIPAYVSIAHIVAEQVFVGESPSIGPYVWRCSRFPDNLGLTGNGHIVRGTAGTPTGIEDGDANPAEVLYEIMTNKTFGLEFEPAQLNFTSFQDAGNTLATENNGWSQVIDNKIQAIDLIKEVLRQIDAVLFEDSAGTFTLRLVRDDYVLASQPLFDESNIIEVERFTRSAWSQTQNDIAIAFFNREENYIETTALAQDTANVRIQGAVLRADETFPGVKHPDTANEIAARELRTLSFPTANVQLVCNREAAGLIPGDVIRFSWKDLGLVDFPLRILDVAQGTLQDGAVTLTTVQDIFESAETQTLMGSPQPSGWTPLDNTAKQSTIEAVREAPRIMLNMSDEFVTGDTTSARAWGLAAGADSVQLQFDMWVDASDGAGYLGPFGRTAHMTPTGTLLSEYPFTTGDVDTGTSLTLNNPVDLADGSPTVEDVGTILIDRNAGEIRRGRNHALIQGTSQALDEIIGYENIIDNGDGTFSLQNVHRGLLDTVARTHPSGTRVWFFTNDASAISSEVFGDTQGSLNWKYLTHTIIDEMEIADDTTPLALTFASRSRRPHVPANIRLGPGSATRLPDALDITMTTAPDHLEIRWDHRINDLEGRARDADKGTPFDPLAVPPEGQNTAIEYKLVFKHLHTGVTVDTATVVSPAPGWLTYLWTDTDAQSGTGEVGNFPLRLEVFSNDTGETPDLTSLQTAFGEFNLDILDGTLQSVDLDGSTEHLANTTVSATFGANTWGFSFWARPDINVGGNERNLLWISPTAAATNRIAVGLTDDSNGSPWFIRLWSSSGTLFKDFEFGTYTSGTWTNIAVSWDGSNLVVLQDGIVDSSPTKVTDIGGAQTSTTRAIYVGADNVATAATLWQGLIHKIAWWDVEPSTSAFNEIWNSGNGSAFNERFKGPLGFYTEDGDLQHFWDFRKSADATLGQDYGNNSILKNISDNAVAVTAADLTSTVPT